MAHPLELSYNWQVPVLFSTVGLAICIGVLARGHLSGWLSVCLILAAIWAVFIALVWLRTRAYILVDGPVMWVRRYQGISEIDGRQVSRMTQFLTPNGPSYRIFAVDASGKEGRYVVPSALLRRGHSTLFEWILTWAPEAQLDKGSSKTLETLRVRGLIE